MCEVKKTRAELIKELEQRLSSYEGCVIGTKEWGIFNKGRISATIDAISILKESKSRN